MKLSTAKSLMKIWKTTKSEMEKLKVDGTIKVDHLFRHKEKQEKKDQ